jgi:hypothetical protein
MKPMSKLPQALSLFLLSECFSFTQSSKALFPFHIVLCFPFYYSSSTESRQDMVSKGTLAIHVVHVWFEECCGCVSLGGSFADFITQACRGGKWLGETQRQHSVFQKEACEDPASFWESLLLVTSPAGPVITDFA